MNATTPPRPEGRRPYSTPTLQKQRNLKAITLFTDFAPDRGSSAGGGRQVRDDGS